MGKYNFFNDPTLTTSDRLGLLGAAFHDIGNSSNASVPQMLPQVQAGYAARAQQKALATLAGSVFNPPPQLQSTPQALPMKADGTIDGSQVGPQQARLVTPPRSDAQTRDYLAYMLDPKGWSAAQVENDKPFTLSEGQFRGSALPANNAGQVSVPTYDAATGGLTVAATHPQGGGTVIQAAPKFQQIGDQYGAIDPTTGGFTAQATRPQTYAEVETNRANVSGEKETNRSHLATEDLTASGQKETAQHDRADEATARGQLGVAQGQLGVAQGNLGVRQQEFNYTKGAERPLPVGIQKLEDQDIDAINGASAINDHLGNFVTQIDNKTLQLGPVSNSISQLRNAAGMSDPHSQAFSDFRSNLEKLRNDSLRLNKGVQTEGDAQRAWNELVSNINDPAVVKKRLQQIQDYNQQAITFHTNAINQRRVNNHTTPLDTTQFQVAPTGTIAPSAPGAAVGGWKITGVH